MLKASAIQLQTSRTNTVARLLSWWQLIRRRCFASICEGPRITCQYCLDRLEIRERKQIMSNQVPNNNAFLAGALSLTFERAPEGPLSSIVFLQFKQLQVEASQRRPALKQSQYKAMHFDFGQLHPEGFSCKGPSSRVAEHKRSSLSNPLRDWSLLDLFTAGDVSN